GARSVCQTPPPRTRAPIATIKVRKRKIPEMNFSIYVPSPCPSLNPSGHLLLIEVPAPLLRSYPRPGGWWKTAVQNHRHAGRLRQLRNGHQPMIRRNIEGTEDVPMPARGQEPTTTY